MIFEYWFRVLIGSDISIQNISNITVEFAAELDMFEASLCHKKIKIENEGKLISKTTSYANSCSAYGTFTASPGKKYHWKLHVIQCEDRGLNQMNIGIADANQAPKLLDQSWWHEKNGYSYFSGNGQMYHKKRGTDTSRFDYGGYSFGEKYGTNDIIDICLDIKDKNELLFSKNDKEIATAIKVDGSTDYKLAVGLYGDSKKVEILSFEITD